VHTWLGWHVIKLIEKKPARVPAFEEVRDEVLEMLRNEKREVAVRALLDRLRKA
jgi:parvulin-like peptidyl-prolyl isomerase